MNSTPKLTKYIDYKDIRLEVTMYDGQLLLYGVDSKEKRVDNYYCEPMGKHEPEEAKEIAYQKYLDTRSFFEDI